MYSTSSTLSSVVSPSMCLSMSVPIVQEEVLVSAVRRKCHCRDAQAGEAALEAVESREGSVVSPRLSEVLISSRRMLSKL